MNKLFLCFIITILSVNNINSQITKTTPGFKADTIIKYKSIGDTDLYLHVFKPKKLKKDIKSACILMFFGGGWLAGYPGKLYPQSDYFASLGMVAVLAEYRVKNRDKTTPKECVLDGKTAYNWILNNPEILNIDTNNIVVGGASAGGHVAATIGTNVPLGDDNKETKIEKRPKALVLFNPVFDNSPGGYGHDRVENYWEEISPMHNLDKDTPPTIVFFGDNDMHVPTETAYKYQKSMENLGLRCDLFIYKNQKHGFFNYRSPKKSDNKYFKETLKESKIFLKSLHIIE